MEKVVLITKGIIKHISGVKRFLPQVKTVTTNDSRYCYSVWLRHLKNFSAFRIKIPQTVAELGPGDSLGTGLAALLSGSNHLFALDVSKTPDAANNLKIFDELAELFRNRSAIPDNNEYPRVRPYLTNYNFPSDIVSDDLLHISLDENRLKAIRNELSDINNPENIFVRFKISPPYSDMIESNTLDFVYSQAVLECIDDLDNIYSAMQKWIKPGGLMSHTIDFKCHGMMKEWNGHWVFSDLEWFLVRGGRDFLINRQPLSRHIEMHTKYGFRILKNEIVRMKNNLDRNNLADKFKSLSEEDITTSGAYILSEKV